MNFHRLLFTSSRTLLSYFSLNISCYLHVNLVDLVLQLFVRWKLFQKVFFLVLTPSGIVVIITAHVAARQLSLRVDIVGQTPVQKMLEVSELCNRVHVQPRSWSLIWLCTYIFFFFFVLWGANTPCISSSSTSLSCSSSASTSSFSFPLLSSSSYNANIHTVKCEIMHPNHTIARFKSVYTLTCSFSLSSSDRNWNS